MAYNVLTVSPDGKALGINCNPPSGSEGVVISMADWDYWDMETIGSNSYDYNKLQIGDSDKLLDTRVCKPVSQGFITPTLAYKQWVFTEADSSDKNFHIYKSTSSQLTNRKSGGKMYPYAYYTRYAYGSYSGAAPYNTIKAQCTVSDTSIDFYAGCSDVTVQWEMVAGVIYEVAT